MQKKIISGIQQVGIGVADVNEAWKWYNRNFGMDVPVFDEDGMAELMLPYTGGQPQRRHAILAMNLNGGGGFEIWQYKNRTPVPSDSKLLLGDLGVNSVKIKTSRIELLFEDYKTRQIEILTGINTDPTGRKTFYIRDPYNNIFQLIESDDWFQLSDRCLTGGTYGFTIGTDNIEKSRDFYAKILGYDKLLFEGKGKFDDFIGLPVSEDDFHRVILTHSEQRKGPFSKLLGPSYIELIQSATPHQRRIYEGRFWGDLGFIHICFDVRGMDQVKSDCSEMGFPFTVDLGSSFQMEHAAGRFAYSESPEGTLIEYVETYKIPILKKFGWYLNLSKRDPAKTIPDWILKSLRFNRKRPE